MVELNWRDYLVMVSFVASIAGLVLLRDNRNSQPTDDSLGGSFAARTLWEKQAKPRVSGTNDRSPQQTAPPWGRPVERLKPSKFRLWAVWAVLMLGGLGLAVNLFYL